MCRNDGNIYWRELMSPLVHVHTPAYYTHYVCIFFFFFILSEHFASEIHRVGGSKKPICGEKSFALVHIVFNRAGVYGAVDTSGLTRSFGPK